MQLKPIYSYISRLAAISLLSLLPLMASAQGSKSQQLRRAALTEADTIPLFRGVAVSADLVGMAQMLLGDYGQYEAAARINLRDRYFPVIEVGIGRADASDVSSHLAYKSSAPYARIGVDFNVMKNKHDVNRVYVGGRYAFSSFRYDLTSTGISDPVWGDASDINTTGNKASCHWLEFVAGIDARLWGPLRLGWSFRYKRRLANSDPAIGKPWYVPGYGREGGARLGATFNATLEL